MRIKIPPPSDIHSHFRQGGMLEKIVPLSNLYYYVVAIGNTDPLISDFQDVRNYRGKIFRQKPKFIPIITMMLTTATTPEIINRAFWETSFFNANSTAIEGALRLDKLEKYYPLLEIIRKGWGILLVHAELTNDPKTGTEIPELEREEAAIPFVAKLVRDMPGLKIVVEHLSTEAGVNFVIGAPDNVGATLTAHHAYCTYEQVCDEKGKIINPHLYCKPVLKREKDRQAVEKFMVSGNPKGFSGSDSAAWSRDKKSGANPAAGICTPDEVELAVKAEIFERNNALDKLGNFMSVFGPNFYGLKLPGGTMVLEKKRWVVPSFCNGLVPFMAGQKLGWQVLR